jgi:hypothetical protein
MATRADAREDAQESADLQTHYTGTNSPLNKGTTIEEVKSAITRTKADKSPDSITNRMLKAGGEPLARVLHSLFQRLWTWGCIPRSWSRVLVQPVFNGKQKDRLEPLSYRGISLSSAMAQTFDIIIDQRLEVDTRIRKTSTSNQFGSKRGNRCSDAIYPCLPTLNKKDKRAAQCTTP